MKSFALSVSRIIWKANTPLSIKRKDCCSSVRIFSEALKIGLRNSTLRAYFGEAKNARYFPLDLLFYDTIFLFKLRK